MTRCAPISTRSSCRAIPTARPAERKPLRSLHRAVCSLAALPRRRGARRPKRPSRCRASSACAPMSSICAPAPATAIRSSGSITAKACRSRSSRIRSMAPGPRLAGHRGLGASAHGHGRSATSSSRARSGLARDADIRCRRRWRKLDPGVIAHLLECRGAWCRIESARSIKGWLERSEIWGVHPDEVVR